MALPRRTLLRGLAVAPVLAGLAACGDPTRTPGGSDVKPEGVARHAYGDDRSQFGDLYLPDDRTTPAPVVVVIHGGFWASTYDLSLGAPLAADLARRGLAAWNLEYRRVGNGGGWPMTGDDVAAGIDKLADLAEPNNLDLDRVVTLGHSAGGHLAVWAAGVDSGRVTVSGAVPQAGVLDFGLGQRDRLGGGAIERLLGSASLADADPAQRLPLGVPVRCVHGVDDQIVPLSQSQSYVDAAVAAGDDATLIEVPGDHFAIIDPRQPAWAACVEAVEGLVS